MKEIKKISLRTVSDRMSENEMKKVVGGYGDYGGGSDYGDSGDNGNGGYSDFIKFTCYCAFVGGPYEQYPFAVYARTLTAALEQANSDCHRSGATCA